MALADDEAFWRARAEELANERDIYREEAQEALHAVYRLTKKIRQLTASQDRLLAVVRALGRRGQ